MKLFAFTVAAVLVATSAFAQQAWPARKTCTVSTPAVKGQPTVRLNRTTVDGKSAGTVEVFASGSKLKGNVGNVRLEMAPTQPVEGLKAKARPYGTGILLTVQVTDQWDTVLRRLGTAHELVIRAGAETFTVPLAGSGAAINALRACAK